MKYKLNTKMFFSTKRADERTYMKESREAIAALMYFLIGSGITLNDEGYNAISDDGKKFFIAEKETKEIIKEEYEENKEVFDRLKDK